MEESTVIDTITVEPDVSVYKQEDVIGREPDEVCVPQEYEPERLKGSMSGDGCDFSNIETRAVIKFFFLQGKAPKEIHTILTETLRERAPSYATVKNWVAQFKRGNFSTCDAPRPGRRKTVTTPEVIDHIHQLILKDRRISAKSIAEQLGISRERVGSIIHELSWSG